jgi:hypothetical protein
MFAKKSFPAALWAGAFVSPHGGGHGAAGFGRGNTPGSTLLIKKGRCNRKAAKVTEICSDRPLSRRPFFDPLTAGAADAARAMPARNRSIVARLREFVWGSAKIGNCTEAPRSL